MIEAFIFNVAVIVAGIYLFHRFQYRESGELVFSKNYITLFMTVIGVLLLSNPVDYKDISIDLAFVPLLFLARYTNFMYTMLSAVIISAANIYLFGGSWFEVLILLIIAAVISTIGPFIKTSNFASLLWLNAIAVVIMGIIFLLFPVPNTLRYFMLLVVMSFLMTICSAHMFNDIWQLAKLIRRYQSEESVDYITGLGNVKEFDRMLNKTNRSENQSVALLLVDIDGFKDVNDAHGHKAGDAVLRQMAQVLTNYVPQNVQTFRNGGEEFSVILENVTLDESIKLAESIRQGVKNSTFHLPNHDTMQLTVSVGVGYLQAEETKSHRKIFKDADDMLHVAKDQGRDTVMFNPIIK